MGFTFSHVRADVPVRPTFKPLEQFVFSVFSSAPHEPHCDHDGHDDDEDDEDDEQVVGESEAGVAAVGGVGDISALVDSLEVDGDLLVIGAGSGAAECVSGDLLAVDGHGGVADVSVGELVCDLVVSSGDVGAPSPLSCSLAGHEGSVDVDSIDSGVGVHLNMVDVVVQLGVEGFGLVTDFVGGDLLAVGVSPVSELTVDEIAGNDGVLVSASCVSGDDRCSGGLCCPC